MTYPRSTFAKFYVNKSLPPTVSTPVFWASYDPRPNTINIATHETTRMYMSLEHHPFHLRTIRRLRELDTTKLQILVTPPKALSDSAFVRNSALHRVRSMLAETMRQRGWNYDGTVREDTENSAVDDDARALHPLTGAYFVMLSSRVLDHTTGQIRQACQELVTGMVRNQRVTMQENIGAKHQTQSRTGRGGKHAQRHLVRPFERKHVRGADEQSTPTQNMDVISLEGINHEVKAD